MAEPTCVPATYMGDPQVLETFTPPPAWTARDGENTMKEGCGAPFKVCRQETLIKLLSCKHATASGKGRMSQAVEP